MRIPSGTLHVVDFKTSQIVSNIQTKDYWDDKRHWEIKNNIDTLEFKVFDNTEHAATLMQQNLVLKEVRDGRIVPYVITEIEKIQMIDQLLFMHLVSGFNLLKPNYRTSENRGIHRKQVYRNGTSRYELESWKTEYAGFHTMTIDEFIDPLKF